MCISPEPRRRSAAGRRAFTLIEMSIAMSLLVLLVGAVFGIVQACTSGAAAVQREETRNREVEGYLDLVRTAFRTQPGDGHLSFAMAELFGKRIPRLTLDGGDFIFPGGSESGFYSALILTAREQVGGLWSLGVEREITEEEEKEQSLLEKDPRAFLPLVADVKSFQWRFYDGRSAQWLIEWPDTNARPSAVELTVELPGSTAPLRSLFWMPNVQRGGRNAGSSGNGDGGPRAPGPGGNPGAPPGGAPGTPRPGIAPGLPR